MQFLANAHVFTETLFHHLLNSDSALEEDGEHLKAICSISILWLCVCLRDHTLIQYISIFLLEATNRILTWFDLR